MPTSLVDDLVRALLPHVDALIAADDTGAHTERLRRARACGYSLDEYRAMVLLDVLLSGGCADGNDRDDACATCQRIAASAHAHARPALLARITGE